MTDLFLKEKSKKEQLLDYMRQMRWTKTSAIIKWGLDNFHTRSERDARDMAQEGKIKRMDKDEKVFRFGNIKEDVWIAI